MNSESGGGAAAAGGGRTAGLLALTITSVLWGTTGTAATFAPEVSPLAIGAAALGIGGLLQAAIAVPALRRHRRALRGRARLVALGALAVALYPLAFYSSMHIAGVAIGSVASLASAPLASGVLEKIVDGRRLGRWWQLAAALGVLGSVMLCLSTARGELGSPGRTLLGVLLGLVAGSTYALFSWACQRLMRAGIERAASMGAVFGLGGLLLMPVLAVTGGPILHSGGNLAVAAYMALIPMFLSYVLFGRGLATVPASTATTVTLTEPAVATLLAVVVVGERLGPLGWAGLLVLAAVLALLALAPPAAAPRPVGVGASGPAVARCRRY